MSSYTYGCVTLTLPDTVPIPADAGSLSATDVRRVPKPRGDLNATGDEVVAVLEEYADLFIGCGVTAAELRAANDASRDADRPLADVRLAGRVLEQTNLLHDADTHEKLRTVLAFVNAKKKFDPSIATRVPRLVDYFKGNG